MSKLSQAQQNVLFKMQHGHQLTKHKMWCGNPSSFSLAIGDNAGEFINKNTINSLIERGLIEFVANDRKSRTRTSDWRLTEAGRKVNS